MGINYTPNMSLPNPVPGTEAGPAYAVDISSCMALLDAHDHSSGSGVPISPGGLNINTDLTFQNNAATNLSLVNLTPGSTPATLVSLYANGNDLYFVDGAGNAVRITQSGAVAGSPGSISNLVSPASASYVAVTRTFVWQSDTNIAANLDAASILLRNITPNSTYALTLSAPAALAANYTITLPSLPVSTSIITMDSSGTQGTIQPDGTTIALSGSTLSVPNGGIGTTQLANQSVTNAKLATANLVLSGSSGVFTTSSTSYVDVTNLSGTITTTGRPVSLTLMADGSGSVSTVNYSASAGLGAFYVQFLRDGATVIGPFFFSIAGVSGSIPSCSIQSMDFVAAGSHTWKVQIRCASGSGIQSGINFAKLLVMEI